MSTHSTSSQATLQNGDMIFTSHFALALYECSTTPSEKSQAVRAWTKMVFWLYYGRLQPTIVQHNAAE